MVLRKLFGEGGQLEEWPKIKDAYASRIMPVEVARVIDRARLAGSVDDEQVVQLHTELRRVLRSISLLALSEGVLERAGGPMPTVLGTLDALHVATAAELARELDAPLILATHDLQMARAARALGLEVRGV